MDPWPKLLNHASKERKCTLENRVLEFKIRFKKHQNLPSMLLSAVKRRTTN